MHFLSVDLRVLGKENCLKNGLRQKKKKAEEYKFPQQVFLGAAKCIGVALIEEIKNPKFTCTALNILISNSFPKAFPKINRNPELPDLNCKSKTL